jgi:hypothetical protein
MELYSSEYLDDKIFDGVEKNLPNVNEILKNIEIRATGKVTSGLSPSGVSKSDISDT